MAKTTNCALTRTLHVGLGLRPQKYFKAQVQRGFLKKQPRFTFFIRFLSFFVAHAFLNTLYSNKMTEYKLGAACNFLIL